MTGHLDQRGHGPAVADGDQRSRRPARHFRIRILQARDQLRHRRGAAPIGEHPDGVIADPGIVRGEVLEQRVVRLSPCIDLRVERGDRLAERGFRRGAEGGVAGGWIQAVVGVGGPARASLGHQALHVALRARGSHLEGDRDVRDLLLEERLRGVEHARRSERPLGPVDVELDAQRTPFAHRESAARLESGAHLLAQGLGGLADLRLARQSRLADADAADHQRAVGSRRLARRCGDRERGQAFRWMHRRCPGPDAKGARPRGQKGSGFCVSGASAGSSLLPAGSALLSAGSVPDESSRPVVVAETTVGPGGGANRMVPAG